MAELQEICKFYLKISDLLRSELTIRSERAVKDKMYILREKK